MGVVEKSSCFAGDVLLARLGVSSLPGFCAQNLSALPRVIVFDEATEEGDERRDSGFGREGEGERLRDMLCCDNDDAEKLEYGMGRESLPLRDEGAGDMPMDDDVSGGEARTGGAVTCFALAFMDGLNPPVCLPVDGELWAITSHSAFS